MALADSSETVSSPLESRFEDSFSTMTWLTTGWLNLMLLRWSSPLLLKVLSASVGKVCVTSGEGGAWWTESRTLVSLYEGKETWLAGTPWWIERRTLVPL